MNSPLYEKLSKLDLRTLIGVPVPESTGALLKVAVRYKINNVAHYYWAHPDTDGWALADDRYFPSLAPPHAVTWFEWQFSPAMARITLDTGTKYNPDLIGFQVGCLLSAMDRQNPEIPADVFAGEPDPVRWKLHATLFTGSARRGRDHLVKYGGMCVTLVNGDGSCALLPDGQADSRVYLSSPGADLDHAQAVSEQIKPMFLALSFLAARNTIVVDHQMAKKLGRGRRGRGGQPEGQAARGYKTLEIRPLADAIRVRREEGQGGQNRKNRKPVPIVRGHFRRYEDADGHRLFGKYAGVFWIPARVSGPGPEREIKL